MIRTLLVDSSPTDALRTETLLKRYGGSIHIIGTAASGSDALLRLQAGGVDAVLTELTLPDMSGLALIKHITTLVPACVTAVVTHIADFDAASSALRLGAADYRAKPLDVADVAELSALIEASYVRRKRYNLAAGIPVQSAQKPSSNDANIGICLFAVGGIQRPGMYSPIEPWGNTDIEKIAREIVSDTLSFVWSFNGYSPSERVLFYQQNGNVDIDWLKCLYRSVSRDIGLPVNALTFDALFPMEKTASITRLARTALGMRCVPGNEQLFIISPNDNNPYPHVNRRDFIVSLVDVLLGSIPCEPFLTSLFSYFKQNSTPYAGVVELFLHACIRAGLPDHENIAVAIITALSWDDMHRRIAAILGADAPNASMHRSSTVPVEDVAAYLENNYPKPITHKTLGIIFGYVPAYLSTMFSRRYGLSPADYLTSIRIRKAEQLLKQFPDMQVRDVAEAVGFKNPNHFSRVFKKLRGYSPSDVHTQPR